MNSTNNTINNSNNLLGQGNSSNNSSSVMNKFQTVKRWFRNSWPFLRTAEEAEIEESDNGFFEETPVESRDASAVLPPKNDDDILMVEDNAGGLIGEKFGERSLLDVDGNIAAKKQHDEDDIIERSNEEEVAAYHYHAMKSGSKSSSSILRHQRQRIKSGDGGNDYDESKKAGSRVLDVTTAIMTSSSPKKEEEERLPRNNRAVQSSKSCRFQLFDITAEVVTEDSNTNASQQQESAQWTPNEITSLRNAYSECNPTSTTFWTDVSILLLESSGRRRSAKECQRCWFGLVGTPRKRVYIKKKRVDNNKFDNEENDGDDDIFDSTPLKHAVEAIEKNLPSYNNDDDSDDDDKVVSNATTSALNNMKSPLHKRPRMFSPKMNKTNPAAAATATTAGDNNKSSNNSRSSRKVMSLSPVFNRRKGYNTYVNNLRKEISRAQRDKQKMMMSKNKKVGGGECNVGDDSSSSIVRVKEKRRVLAELDTSNGLFSLNVRHDDNNDDESDDDNDESGEEVGEPFWLG